MMNFSRLFRPLTRTVRCPLSCPSRNLQQSLPTEVSSVVWRKDKVDCLVWSDASKGENLTRWYSVASLPELIAKVSKDGRLAYEYPPDPTIPVSIVCVKNGEEINSMDDLCRLAHQQHQFVLIPDNAMASIHRYNKDRTCRLLRELKKELEVCDRDVTLEKWKTFRLRDLRNIAFATPAFADQRVGWDYTDYCKLQEEVHESSIDLIT